jgi:ribosomal protein S18 acetylase RimI-like enzyme
MTTVGAIERAASVTWSPDERTTLAGWELSSSAGFTRRTNSAAPTATAATDIEARAAVESWLVERGARLVVRVTPLADERLIERITESWGLERADETVVMVTGRLTDLPFRMETVDPSESDFAAELLSMNGRPARSIDAWTRMVTRLGENAVGIWDRGTAVGLGTVADDLAAVYSVAVDPAYRRKGIATNVMATAESWAISRGAETAFLQVREDNGAGRAMYRKLGYEEQYRYHYLIPRATGA